MKRMTSSNYNPCVNCIYSSSCSHIKHNDPVCPERARYDRLAAIEDILGDEYDLDRLRELAQADRVGHCIVFDLHYPVVSEYYKDEDGLFIREASGVISKEEYEAALRREQDG